MGLIVSLSILSFENNKYYLHGELFTGVAVSFLDCTVSEKIKVERGVYVKPYEGGLLEITPTQLLVNFSCLKEEEHGPDVPYSFDKKLFSGVAFEFQENICIGEYVFENGWVSDSVNYRKSGEIAGFDLMANDFAQRAEFYEGGAIKNVYLFKCELFHATFVFDELGRIASINIEGSYFDNIKSHQSELRLKIPESKNFGFLKGSHFLKLSGEEVDDELFESLYEGGISDTSKLWIWRTPMTTKSINLLGTLNSLKDVRVESETLTLDDLKRFKIQRPDCYVEFNREEVTV
ncbi:MAG: hypothetical protein GY941_18760 [Planctomycetes bacterium]|nr:hypothetical protein [Planctomycetota bacterium]